MPFGAYDMVGRLAPDIFARPAGTRVGPRVDAVDGEHAERRDPVLAEILVLVVTPDQHEIRVEGVKRLAALAEAVDETRAVLLRGGDRVGPFLAHRLRPACRVLHLLRHLLAIQSPVQEPGHLLVRLDQPGVMRDADAEDLAHIPAPSLQDVRLRRFSTNAGAARGYRTGQACSLNPARP